MKSELAVILVFKKHWKLFIISLLACLALGTMATTRQINLIKDAQNQPRAGVVESPINDESIILRIYKYKQVAIPDDTIKEILTYFVNEDIILDYRLYNRDVFFDTYVIFYDGSTNPVPFIAQFIENHPIIVSTKEFIFSFVPLLNDDEFGDVKNFAKLIQKRGFFDFINNNVPQLNVSSHRPINKHYIYLDKNRDSIEKYSISSTEVIKNHQSLNSNKIWGFMIICSIMISIFIIFTWENFLTLRQKFNNKQS